MPIGVQEPRVSLADPTRGAAWAAAVACDGTLACDAGPTATMQPVATSASATEPLIQVRRDDERRRRGLPGMGGRLAFEGL